MTLTASAYKVFSDNPKIGFFAQRDATQNAIDAGKVLPPAKSMDDMHTIVTNTTVDGILAAFFALMVIIFRGRARDPFEASNRYRQLWSLLRPAL